MPLRPRLRRRLAKALDLLAREDVATRNILGDSVDGSFTSQDVAAALLGGDLWYEPLLEYRSYLAPLAERPHLWNFTLGPSGVWESAAWRSLSLTARVARARIASLVHDFDFVFAPSALGMRSRDLLAALRELQAINLAREIRPGVHRVIAIAQPEALDTDLRLIEIIAHWLCMLRHAERVAADRAPTGYEVFGYDRACARCRTAWGPRPREERWIPPFHPGCRCFAQPRFSRMSATSAPFR